MYKIYSVISKSRQIPDVGTSRFSAQLIQYSITILQMHNLHKAKSITFNK